MSETIDAATLMNRMEGFASALKTLLAGVGEDARWRPPGGGWTLLEIVHHLLDEEREDFRARLQSILTDPTRPWDPLDPPRMAVDRRYNEQDLPTVLARFVEERGRTLDWLRHLQHPRWQVTYPHKPPGPLRAADLLASFAAHDALHLRQIGLRLHELAARDAPGASLAYAGPPPRV